MKTPPILEVNEKQYNNIIANLSGLIFHRIENGKFFIKLVSSKYAPYLKQYL